MKKIIAIGFAVVLTIQAQAGVEIITADSESASDGLVAVTGVFTRVSANVGDVIVAGVAGNKKGSAVAISLVQTGGTGATGGQSPFTNDADTYPTAWLFHQTVTASGTFDYEWRSSGPFTGSGAIYVLRSDSGLIDVAGDAVWDNTDGVYVASNSLSYTFTSAVTNAVAIEAVNARKDNVTAPVGHDVEIGDGEKRLVASCTNITGSAWTNTYALSDEADADQTSGAAGLVFASATVSAPELSVIGPQTQSLSSSVLTNDYSVAVQKGDVVVMAVTGNKATGDSLVSFSSTAGSFTTVNTTIYPSAYAAWLTVGATGTYDFQAIASASITAQSSVYVLRSDTGAITLIDSATFENADANSEPDESLVYSLGSGVTHGIVIEAISSRTSAITPQDTSIDYASSTSVRLLCRADVNGTVFTSTYSFTNGVADKMTYSGAGLLFAPIINPPMPPEFLTDPVVKNAFVSGYAYSGSLAEDATDPNSDPLTFSVTPTNTWLAVAPDGTLSGTPQSGDTGTNEWTVFVTDGISGTNNAVLRIDIVNGAPPTPQTSQTNIVLIVIDDLGWMDLSIQGSEFYETPRIDELAQNGMRFTQGYAAHPRCLPSRYGLMTGRFPGASAVPAEPADLIDEEVTIGEALQPAGYATFFAGKWHISHEDALLPQRQGFDVNITGGANGSPPSYFYPYGNEPANELDGNGLFLDNATPIGGMVTDRITGARYPRTYHAGESGEYITDRLTDEALDWMEWNANRPMFLYMSHYGVHTPYEAPSGLVAKYETKLASMDYGDMPEYIASGVGEEKMRQDHPTYAAMIESVDTNIGRLMDKVQELGIAGNTIFIFTSDNGGLSNRGGYNTRELATSNYPLRTGKGWLYEGGIREAFIVKGPGVPAMVNSNAVVNGTDIYPTILEIAGQSLRPLDHRNGVSFKSALSGAAYDRGEPILWHSPLARPYATGDFNSTALRDGDYKLIWWYDTPGRDGEFHYELYNVKDDPGETVDLSLSMPAKAADLLAQIKEWHKGDASVHWVRSVGVIKRTDADDVSKPPAPYLVSPFAPMDLNVSGGNVDLAWGDWVGYDFNVWSKTNLLDPLWVPEGSGLTVTNLTLPVTGPTGFYQLELLLQTEN